MLRNRYVPFFNFCTLNDLTKQKFTLVIMNSYSVSTGFQIDLGFNLSFLHQFGKILLFYFFLNDRLLSMKSLTIVSILIPVINL